MSDAFTFVAQAAAAGNLKLEVSFKKRNGSTTDPSCQRDTWGCRFLSPETGRVLGEWNNFEVRDEMFETAARAVATTAATQLGNWDKQIQAQQDVAAKKALEEKMEAAKTDMDARQAEIKAAVEDELAKDTNGEEKLDDVIDSSDEDLTELSDAAAVAILGSVV